MCVLLDNSLGEKISLKDKVSRSFVWASANSIGITKISNIFKNIIELCNDCFSTLFDGCTNLNTVVIGLLPWEELKLRYFYHIFYNYTSLKIVSELPSYVAEKYGFCLKINAIILFQNMLLYQ